MALFTKGRKNERDPGTGTGYSANSKRVINKDGSFNVIKTGLGFSTRDTYQYLLQISWSRFLIIIFLFLFVVNALFALIYLVIGIEELMGVEPNDMTSNFLQSFYFSFQTFTTVGYGSIAPRGDFANIIAVIESISGWMCFAVVTGLLYGRFSRPSARLFYSKKALIAPYKKGMKSVQFRVANMRNSNLMEMDATVMLVTVERKGGKFTRQFHRLELERSFILFFPLNWTIVHPIDEKSPLYGITREKLKSMEAEILIMIKGFDDTFSQTVHSRYSYKCSEIVWGGKYIPVYETAHSGDIMLHFENMHDYEEVPDFE